MLNSDAMDQFGFSFSGFSLVVWQQIISNLEKFGEILIFIQSCFLDKKGENAQWVYKKARASRQKGCLLSLSKGRSRSLLQKLTQTPCVLSCLLHQGNIQAGNLLTAVIEICYSQNEIEVVSNTEQYQKTSMIGGCLFFFPLKLILSCRNSSEQ